MRMAYRLANNRRIREPTTRTPPRTNKGQPVIDTELRDAKYEVAIEWRWDHVFDLKVQRARKQHVCNDRNCCRGPIKPGEIYLKVVWAPPWACEADVDDEGRTIAGAPIGEWTISKYHRECALH
jgi:hypothetical protein